MCALYNSSEFYDMSGTACPALALSLVGFRADVENEDTAWINAGKWEDERWHTVSVHDGVISEI